MTPGLFAGTDARDEYAFMQTNGAREKLRQHQKTFIIEDDFRWLRDHGINAVRIPIGYWIFEGDAPYRSCIGRLDWAVRMAKKYDIAVLICLHGAPGSQNGHDHSGQKGQARWHDKAEFQQQTIDVLARLAKRYRNDEAVWGIELLNEPVAKFFQPLLRKFYRQAYDAIVAVGRDGLAVVFHDAFSPLRMSGALWAYKRFPVYLDHHWYHFFIARWLQPHVPFWLYYRYLQLKRIMLRNISTTQPVIIGEWSGIIGGEKIHRYPKDERNQYVVEHLRQQFETFSDVAGWFYWTYRTEEPGVFNFRSMVDDGVITMPTSKN